MDRCAAALKIVLGSAEELRGHTNIVLRTRYSPNGETFLSFSTDGSVRVWASPDGSLIRTYSEHQSVVGDAEYIDGGRQIVSSGDDGRLLRWAFDRKEAFVLFKHTAPLGTLEVLTRNAHVVVHDDAGALWDVSPAGVAKQVRTADGIGVRFLRASPDGQFVALGNAAGVVTVHETERYATIAQTTLPDSVRQIYFQPHNRDLLISSESGHVRLVPLGPERVIPWRDLELDARDVAYSPNGETIAFVCSNGGSWFYVIHENKWVYARDHAASIQSGRFSPDGRSFASADRSGNVVIRDVLKTLSKKL